MAGTHAGDRDSRSMIWVREIFFLFPSILFPFIISPRQREIRHFLLSCVYVCVCDWMQKKEVRGGAIAKISST